MFSFKLAGNFYSGGYPLPPAHINHAFGQALGWNMEGRRGENLLGSHSKMRTKWLPLYVCWYASLFKSYIF